MQKVQRFVADQRLDLEHVKRMLGYLDFEFVKLNKHLLSPENKIFKGWEIASNGGLQVKINQTEDSFLINSERADHESSILIKAAEALLTLDLADNALNFIEVQFTTETGAEDTVALWDTAANDGKGSEYSQVVDTCTHEEPTLVSNTVSFTGDPDKIPVAIVTTSGGVITGIQDVREFFFHLANDWDFGLTRTDKTISNFSEMYYALTTSMKEHKGTPNWFDLGISNRLLKEYQNLFITGGGAIEWEGTQGANTLGWSAALLIEIADRANSITISAGTVVLAEGECAYIIIPDDVPSAPIALQVANIADVPINPASAGFDPRIQVLFLRRGNAIAGWMNIPSLSSGEISTIGLDLPTVIRNRLGIINETTYVAYGSTHAILAADSYATAIGKLDTELFEVTDMMRITKHESVDYKARVAGIDKILSNGSILSEEVNLAVMSFGGAVINFSTGAVLKSDDSTPLGANFSPYAIPVNEYFWYGVSAAVTGNNANGTKEVNLAITPAASSNAVAANAVIPQFPKDHRHIGAVLVRNTGSLEVYEIRQFPAAKGENNTASNVGAVGAEVFKDKSGIDLRFRRILTGLNMDISQSADNITLNALAGPSNISGTNSESVRFQANGPYAIADGVDGIYVFRDPASINGVTLARQVAGISGYSQVDIQIKPPLGVWTSIFTTLPAIGAAAGNDAFCYTGSSNPNTTAPIMFNNPINVPTGTMMRMNVTAIEAGSPTGLSAMVKLGISPNLPPDLYDPYQVGDIPEMTRLGLHILLSGSNNRVISEFRVFKSGTVRMKVTNAPNDTNPIGVVEFRKNNVVIYSAACGAFFQGALVFSHDVSVNAGDRLMLSGYSGHGSINTYVQNFRICVANPITNAVVGLDSYQVF